LGIERFVGTAGDDLFSGGLPHAGEFLELGVGSGVEIDLGGGGGRLTCGRFTGGGRGARGCGGGSRQGNQGRDLGDGGGGNTGVGKGIDRFIRAAGDDLFSGGLPHAGQLVIGNLIFVSDRKFDFCERAPEDRGVEGFAVKVINHYGDEVLKVYTM
jgi:hypothetical protein